MLYCKAVCYRGNSTKVKVVQTVPNDPPAKIVTAEAAMEGHEQEEVAMEGHDQNGSQ